MTLALNKIEANKAGEGNEVFNVDLDRLEFPNAVEPEPEKATSVIVVEDGIQSSDQLERSFLEDDTLVADSVNLSLLNIVCSDDLEAMEETSTMLGSVVGSIYTGGSRIPQDEVMSALQLSMREARGLGCITPKTCILTDVQLLSAGISQRPVFCDAHSPSFLLSDGHSLVLKDLTTDKNVFLITDGAKSIRAIFSSTISPSGNYIAALAGSVQIGEGKAAAKGTPLYTDVHVLIWTLTDMGVWRYSGENALFKTKDTVVSYHLEFTEFDDMVLVGRLNCPLGTVQAVVLPCDVLKDGALVKDAILNAPSFTYLMRGDVQRIQALNKLIPTLPVSPLYLLLIGTSRTFLLSCALINGRPETTLIWSEVQYIIPASV